MEKCKQQIKELLYKTCLLSRSPTQCSAMCIAELACSAFKFVASNGECQFGSKFNITTTTGPVNQTSQVHVLEDNEGM
jgi:hypothetical protein